VGKPRPAPCSLLPAPSGFTLLEIIIALSVFLIVMAGVFAIAKGSMELSADLTSTQERAMTRQNFIEFLRASFRRLPGEAELTLTLENQRGTYVPTLNVYNGGDAFSTGPSLPPESSVELFAQQMAGDYLRVGLRVLDDQQTQQQRSGRGFRRSGAGAGDAILPLIDKVAKFEWKFYNPATQRWEENWKPPARPLFAELSFMLDDGIPSRMVFWIPPVMRRQPGVGLPSAMPTLGPDGQPVPAPVVQNPSVNPNANPNPAPALQQ
jgi:prepilin-type N-terminal cleavage/methylation domain-containing protein